MNSFQEDVLAVLEGGTASENILSAISNSFDSASLYNQMKSLIVDKLEPGIKSETSANLNKLFSEESETLNNLLHVLGEEVRHELGKYMEKIG